MKGILRNRHLGMMAKRQLYEGVIVETVKSALRCRVVEHAGGRKEHFRCILSEVFKGLVRDYSEG